MASLVDDSWPIQTGMTITVLQNPLRTQLHSTGETRFSVPSHWHSMHDENHVVLKGSMIVTQNGVKRVLRAGDAPCFTPRGVIHSLEILPGEEVIMEEETLPSEAQEQKVLFFRSLFFPGVLGSFFSMMQLFYHGDTYPELPLGNRWLERLMTVVVGGWVAPLLGYRLPDKRLRMDPKRFPR
ncbi:hypothetical protein FB45DRAFT_910557 [Roridomyces roridus]|uniref:Cupin type-2 domain-containing protein n=1 Tax=Roridomyces roridus TaxID=1738132 RepID=A0AAD7FRH3_9AGAR|nr:hypothetical protein FB45DRAFT_910557 [Roridomyces roridus]